jgi:hypothetical protein
MADRPIRRRNLERAPPATSRQIPAGVPEVTEGPYRDPARITQPARAAGRTVGSGHAAAGSTGISVSVAYPLANAVTSSVKPSPVDVQSDGAPASPAVAEATST